eukprot:5819965-Pleurochrysis_carterae.AAC.3
MSTYLERVPLRRVDASILALFTIFAGTAPLIATGLAETSLGPLAVGLYLSATAALSTAVVLFGNVEDNPRVDCSATAPVVAEQQMQRTAMLERGAHRMSDEMQRL